MAEKKGKAQGKQEFVIEEKAYEMMVYAYPVLDQFPKAQKFSLAQDIRSSVHQVQRYVIEANKAYGNKVEQLRALDTELAVLRKLIRAAFDLRYLPPKKYEHWTGLLVELGKMVGGWIKAAKGVKESPDQLSLEGALGEDGKGEDGICADCGAKIKANAVSFSVSHFKRALCYSCQHKERKKGG